MRGSNERDEPDAGFRLRPAPGAAGLILSASAAGRLGTSRVERFEFREGPESGELTRVIPRRTLAHLDERGLARVGQAVTPGLVLIGAQRAMRRDDVGGSPEEQTLRALLGEDVVDVSVRAPAELDGEVIRATVEGAPGARHAQVVVRVLRPLTLGDVVERGDGATATVIAIDPSLEVDALWPGGSEVVTSLRRIDAARDVLHARSIGPYSIVTQQPLEGKASFGGQRVGRAELQALCERGAWGLAHELMTVKSDDVEGRMRFYEGIVLGDPRCPATRPEAAAMLLAYLAACGLDVDEEGDEVAAPPTGLFSFGAPPVPEALTLRFATSESVRARSRGVVTVSDAWGEGGAAVAGGLLCPRLFGPMVDFECACGELRGMRHRGEVCARCGVEVTRAHERRRRFAHVELAAPVLHPMAFDLVATLLGVTTERLRAVLAHERTLEGDEDMGDDAHSGITAIEAALAALDLDALAREEGLRGVHVREVLAASLRPASLVLRAWPVLPADLRPAGPGTRYVTDDLNDLYRRLIIRNQRLARLIELNAPPIIVRNERRMLQACVDALVENGRHEPAVTHQDRRLRSVLHFLADPGGLVDQHLASKRVDYSAVAVAIPSEIPTGRVRIPRAAARELLKPSVFGELEAAGHASGIKAAKALVEAGDPRADEALEVVRRQAPLVAFPFPDDREPTQAWRPPTPLALEIELGDAPCAELSAADLAALGLAPGGRVLLFLPLDPRAIREARECLRAGAATTPVEGAQGWLAELAQPRGVAATRAHLVRVASRAERDPLVDPFARLVLGLPPT